MLTCAKCAEVLPDILDGTGDPNLRVEFLAQTTHRAKCQRCVETYQKSAHLTRYAFSENKPTELCEHLLAFLRDRLDHEP